MCWNYADYFTFIIPLHFPTVMAHKGVKSKQKNDLKLLGRHLALDKPSMNSSYHSNSDVIAVIFSHFLLVRKLRHREVKCKATQLVIAELKLEPALPSSDAYSITIYKGKYHIVPALRSSQFLLTSLFKRGSL